MNYSAYMYVSDRQWSGIQLRLQIKIETKCTTYHLALLTFFND